MGLKQLSREVNAPWEPWGRAKEMIEHLDDAIIDAHKNPFEVGDIIHPKEEGVPTETGE